MGQKVNPVGMRIGLNKDWNSRWFASDKDYATLLNNDIKVREFLGKKLPKDALVSHIEIERKERDGKPYAHVIIFAARPGVVLGQEGALIKELKAELQKVVGKNVGLKLDVEEVKQPQLDATIEATKICQQLEARASFRIVQKKALAEIRKAGAKGCKTKVSGRLAGADIARSEGYKEGTMAINTLKSDIDYAHAEAMTTYGKLGVKVWICRGEKVADEKPSTPESKKGE